MELELKHGLHLRVMRNSDFNYTLDCGRRAKYTDDQEVNTVIANWPWHPSNEVRLTRLQPNNGHDIYWLSCILSRKAEP